MIFFFFFFHGNNHGGLIVLVIVLEGSSVIIIILCQYCHDSGFLLVVVSSSSSIGNFFFLFGLGGDATLYGRRRRGCIRIGIGSRSHRGQHPLSSNDTWLSVHSFIHSFLPSFFLVDCCCFRGSSPSGQFVCCRTPHHHHPLIHTCPSPPVSSRVSGCHLLLLRLFSSLFSGMFPLIFYHTSYYFSPSIGDRWWWWVRVRQTAERAAVGDFVLPSQGVTHERGQALCRSLSLS